MFYLELWSGSRSPLVVYVGSGTYCSLFSDGIAGGIVEYNALFAFYIFSLFILLIETVDWEFFLLDSEIPCVAQRELLFKLIKWVGWKPLFGARVPPFVKVIFDFFSYFA